MYRKTAVTICMVLALGLPISVAASADDIAKVNEMIEQLPEVEDIKEDDAAAVKEAMEAYQALSTADKLKVEGYEKLDKEYENMINAGFITDEERRAMEEAERARREQGTLQTSGQTESEATSYVFNISDVQKDLSVVVRYVTDLDGDGYGDMPDRIVLTSPSGSSTSLSNASANLSDGTMNITCTWERNFLQLDIASAEYGKWSITTSDPVTFTKMPYAGVKQEIVPEDDRTQEDAAVTDEEEPKKKGKGGMILTLVILLGALTFLFRKYGPKPKKKKKEPEEEEIIPKELTDEEVKQQMREEYLERKEREKDLEEDEYLDEEEESYIDSRGGEAETAVVEYNEGDTDLLKKNENPALNGGGLKEEPAPRINSFFEDDEDRFG